MKKYWFYGVVPILLLLIVAACAPEKTSVKRDSAGKILGDPTGRVFNPQLSCIGYCSGYAASGNGWCFCDIPCSKNGNCCSDFEIACPNEAAGEPSRVLNLTLSCTGHCSGYAESESGDEWCFCDAACEQNRNCCADFKEACPFSLPSEPSPELQSAMNQPTAEQLALPDPTGLTRNYPDFMKCAAISAPELPELTRHIEELKALGHNTICIGQGIDQFNPRIDEQESAAMQPRTLSAIVTFKKAGFAISLDIDSGGPISEKEYTKLMPEQFLHIVEEEVLRWAALAEEYQIEYFTPASEISSKLHNLYLESERQQKKVERANRWYNEVLPKVQEVFQGKVVVRLGAYYPELRPQGYDVVAYTTGHTFFTDLEKFRQEIQKVYAVSRELAQENGAAWWVTTYFAYEESFNPDSPIEYTTLGTELRELQDDYYRITIEEIDTLLPEQRPTGFEGGHIPVSPTTKTTDEAKEVVQNFFTRDD